MIRLRMYLSLLAACFLFAVSCNWDSGGGPMETFVPVDTVFEYDPQTDTWTQKASMPTPKGGAAAIAVNGKIYVMSGVNRTTEAFDPVSDTWETKATLPDGSVSSYTVVGNKAFTIFYTYRTWKMYEYDTVLDLWTEKSTPAREHLDIAALGTDIYGSSETVFRKYDTIADTWSRCANVPVRYYTPVVASGKVFAVGGSNSMPETPSQMWEYDPVADLWSQKSDLLIPQDRPDCAVIGNKIYTIRAEWGVTSPPEIVQEYDTVSDTWTRKLDCPFVPPDCSFSINGKIYLLGRYPGSFVPIYQFDPVADTWTPRATLTLPIYLTNAGFACELGGKIYLMGGEYMVF